MEARAKAAGHAIHPMLIVLPLGLLWTATAFDVVDALAEKPSWGRAAYLMIGAGLVGGVIAGFFGFLDWLSVPKGTRARRIGMLHGITNEVLLGLFLVAWLVRGDEPDNTATPLALTLALAGIAVSVVSGWLGGELVERLGVSVTPGAHLDAPSSLRTAHVVDLADPKEHQDVVRDPGVPTSRRSAR